MLEKTEVGKTSDEHNGLETRIRNAIYVAILEGLHATVARPNDASRNTRNSRITAEVAPEKAEKINAAIETGETEIEKAAIGNVTADKIKSINCKNPWRDVMKASFSLLKVFHEERFECPMTRFLCTRCA